MSKKAILTIDLAYESEKETNSQIIKEIQQDSQIHGAQKYATSRSTTANKKSATN